ncbi:MAG: hypothetical protein AMXMBFR83_03910 [Phycisphaerae bacterium]
MLARQTRKLQEDAFGANELGEHKGEPYMNRNIFFDSRLQLFARQPEADDSGRYARIAKASLAFGTHLPNSLKTED